MMTRLALFLIALMGAAPAAADDPAARRTQCVGWMMAGSYPNGLVEKTCQTDFALPSAFMFKCARAQWQGFSDDRQRAACTMFFAAAATQAERGYVLN